MSGKKLNGLNIQKHLPKSNKLFYYPTDPPQGPDFIDTGHCHCALRDVPDRTGQAWRCLGDAQENIYKGSSGKWFRPEREDGISPPVRDTTLVVPRGSNHLVDVGDLDEDPFTPFDRACTGKRNAATSQTLAQARQEQAAGKTAVSAAMCWKRGAVPMILQNQSSWMDDGCSRGFYCPNNTINSLPQYCSPVKECLIARLGHQTCRGYPMGPYEPVICSAGFYCPPGGKEKIACPEGHYCPPGSSEPIRCDVGARCPKLTLKNQGFFPLAVLLILDVLMIAFLLIRFARFRLNLNREMNLQKTKSKGLGTLTRMATLQDWKQRHSGYESLGNEEGAINPDARVVPTVNLPSNFQAAMDSAYLEGGTTMVEEKEPLHVQGFVKSLRQAMEGDYFGLAFGFRNLMFQPSGNAKPILSNITGDISRGALVGVMGGSGAGKSTFVNVLMGKLSSTSGEVQVNGVADKVGKYKKIIGYVPQDDIVLPELTVRENILHSARIRMPADWSSQAIDNHVDALIECLELTHVKNSLVGTTAKPVISGGQKKRVSIGLELAAAPMALFLDEPTSGLDATAASSVMKTLKALSRLGITVVSIIHQPRQEIFEALDDLILLANGRLIYQGKEKEAQTYFQNAGFHFPYNANPADIVMDIITGNGRPYKSVGDTSKESLISYWTSIQNARSASPASAVPSETSSRRHISFMTSTNSALRRSTKKRGAPFHRQLWHCLLRALLQQYRTKSSFFFEIGVASLGGFLIGLAQNSHEGNNFTGLYHEPYEALSSAMDYQSVPIMALLVAISIGLIASSPGVKVFGEEKLVYWREASSGHNRLAYYLGKLIASLPRVVLGCFHFTTFFMLLATPIISWPRSFAANLLYYLAVYGLASCVSMVTRREDGPLLATMASLIVGVLSGFAPTLAVTETWHMSWLWRASPGVWIAELYFSDNITPLRYLYQVENASENTGFVLDRYGVDCWVLLAIGLVYRILAFIGMVLVKRNKQR
ncbi:MAG: hypothetical protein M1831_003976 [Alyxoria varia]|nr:MAG: hypothetical protein M1831_003976 [Alyxoria varia]